MAEIPEPDLVNGQSYHGPVTFGFIFWAHALKTHEMRKGVESGHGYIPLA